MNTANKKTDQRLSEFQNVINTTVHATLDIEQLIFHTRMHLLIPLLLYNVLMERLFQLHKCMNCLPRFMTFWAMLHLNGLVIQLIF